LDNPSSILFLRFHSLISRWRSRSMNTAFNSLFEILFRLILKPPYFGRESLSFNSLFEIRWRVRYRDLAPKPCFQFSFWDSSPQSWGDMGSSTHTLSILFLRFLSRRTRRIQWTWLRLSILFLRFEDEEWEASGVEWSSFQFSFWDSVRLLICSLILKGRLRTFNSLFEILLPGQGRGWDRHNQDFQFSFWDSWWQKNTCG